MKNLLCRKISGILPEMSYEQALEIMEVPVDEKMGDYAIPCFSFAKKYRKNPAAIAAEFKQVIGENKEYLKISKVERAGGYCNIFMDRENLVKTALEKLMQKSLGIQKCGDNRTICIDYSSPNIAKNFHVGHLRTTIIGNSLYKIFEKLGYNVVRINYLGDWGTQFGKLIVAYRKWSSKEKVEESGIEELLRLYVKFNEAAKNDSSLMDEAPGMVCENGAK